MNILAKLFACLNDHKQMPIPQETMDILESRDAATLVEWSEIINDWGWPEGLPGGWPNPLGGWPKPLTKDNWKHCLGASVARWIKSQMNERLFLRHHNKKMTDAEFLDFWRGHYCGDKDAAERDLARIKRLVDAQFAAKGEKE